jgi:hypothetical protein
MHRLETSCDNLGGHVKKIEMPGMGIILRKNSNLKYFGNHLAQIYLNIRLYFQNVKDLKYLKFVFIFIF